MPGIAEQLKRRRLSRTAKRRRSPEHRCCVEGRLVSATARSDPRGFAEAHGGGTHLGLRGTRHPSRGDAGTGGLRGELGPLSRLRSRDDQAARWEQHARKGPPFVAVLARQRGVRNRFEKGTRPPKGGANLGSSRPGPAGTLPRKPVPAWLVSLNRSFAKGGR
jgi:hypothetical protein